MIDVPGQNGSARVSNLFEQNPLLDMDLESQVLGTCIIHPHYLKELDLSASDFAGGANRIIWSAIVGVYANEGICDTTLLRAYLQDAGKLANVGGLEYLLSLTDSIILSEPHAHVARLKRLAIQRRLRNALMFHATHLQDADASAKFKLEIDRLHQQLEALDQKPGTVAVLRTSKALADLVETQVSDGIYFPTGFHKLDAELDDGGLPTKSLTVIVGGPGSKKTGVGTHYADHLSRLGAAVVFMACDESRQSIVTRLGQRAGFSRQGLRDKDEIGAATRAGHRRYEADLGRVLHLIELDDETDAQTIEEAHEELVRIAGDRPRVLIIDSLQTVRCAAAEAMAQGADNLRMRVDAKVATLKRLKRTGTIIIVISEVSRAFYNGTAKRIEREHVLSAAKESGGIEFGVDLLIGLVRSAQDEELVELVVAKCRIGREPRFFLRWDRDRAQLEDARAEEATDEQLDAQEAQRTLELRQRILKAVVRRPGLSKAEIRDDVKVQRALVFRTVAEMVREGWLLEQPRNAYRVGPNRGGVPHA